MRTRLRLHRGGVQPVALWGFEGQGLAPKYRMALRLNLHEDWATIEQTLHHEAQQQRTSRLASKKNCQSLVSGLDWTIANKAIKVLPKQQAQHIKTWNQAAIHCRQGDKPKPCPLCGVPATPKHIVWLCTWHHNQDHTPLAVEWTERLQDPLEEPLWAHGWIPREPQDHLQVAQPLQGHGCWSSLEALPLQPWQGLSVTLDATPSSYDPRSQAWVFGLCIHTYSMEPSFAKAPSPAWPLGPKPRHAPCSRVF